MVLKTHNICVCCPPDCLPCQQIFCKTSKLSYYFYLEKKYVSVSDYCLKPTKHFSAISW